MVQKKIPLINSAHGSDTRNIINELIKLFNQLGYTYDDALKKAHDVLEEAKKTNNENASVQKQINTLIAESGTSGSELVQARFDAEGNEYSVLKERLDEKEVNTQKELSKKDLEIKRVNQLNFHEWHKRNALYDGAHLFHVLGDRYLVFEMDLGNGETFDWHFNKNNLDDLIKFRTGHLQKLNLTEIREDFMDSNVGVWNMNSSASANPFASVPDTTITHQFEGKTLYFHHFTDDRGGVWEFKIDNGGPVTLSTHVNAVSESEKIHASIAKRLIADDLSDGPHTLVMTFIGDDTNHPPSSGAGNSRGWTRRNDGSSNTPALNVETFLFFDERSSQIEVISDSNKDFAFSAKKTGTSHTTQWFPEHNSIGTAFKGHSGFQKLYIDGAETSLSSPKNRQPFKTAIIVQRLEFIHPQESNPLAVQTTSTTISSEGVHYYSEIEWLQDVDISAGYVNMMTINTEFGTDLSSSFGGTYDLTVTDGSTEYLNEQMPFGFAATSAMYPEYMTYIQSFTPSDLRLNEAGRSGDEDGSGFYSLQHRNARLQKLYPHVYSSHKANSGEIFRYEGHWGFLKHPAVKELF